MPGPRRTLRRIEDPGHGRYLTFSCFHRLALFSNDAIKDAFVDHLTEVKQQLGFELYAWAVMPEHVHLLLRTASYGLTVETILAELKSPFAKRVIGRWRKLEAPILSKLSAESGRKRFWQPGGGYDRNIHSDGEVFEKIEYIHDNPVRRGLVLRQTDYRWSSARWYNGDTTWGPTIDPIL